MHEPVERNHGKIDDKCTQQRQVAQRQLELEARCLTGNERCSSQQGGHLNRLPGRQWLDAERDRPIGPGILHNDGGLIVAGEQDKVDGRGGIRTRDIHGTNHGTKVAAHPASIDRVDLSVSYPILQHGICRRRPDLSVLVLDLYKRSADATRGRSGGSELGRGAIASQIHCPWSSQLVF